MNFKIERQFIITLLHLPKITRNNAYKLLKGLDEDILSLGELVEYIVRKGDSDWVASLTIDDFGSGLDLAYKIMQDSKEADIKMVSILDDDYPELIKMVDNPPVILNYKGDLKSLNEKPTIAVIGTRSPSVFGKEYAKHVGKFFSSKGFNVISGLAKGIDTEAHLGVLETDGITTAVLAHGLDTIYPRDNALLAERITENGLLISEYFVGTKISKRQFIDRNRIQAGLSLVVFIVECDINSGTMHTANFALSNHGIIACMMPPLEHFDECKVAGNMELTRAGKALGLYSDAELETLAKAFIIPS